MAKKRKPRARTAGPLPPLSRLKRLPQGDQDLIVQWLEDKTQSEVGAMIMRAYDIEPGSPESWPSLLTEFWQWYQRQADLLVSNAIAEQVKEFYEAGASDLSPEELRDYQLRRLTAWHETAKKKDPYLMIALAKELRMGMQAKTAERKLKVLEARNARAAEELKKLRDPAAADSAETRQAILDEVDRIMGLKK